MLADRTEFCRVFFRPTSIFPRQLVFGLDPVSLDLYEEFRRKSAGKVVGRYDQLVVYVGNKESGVLRRLAIDLDPLWPSIENPSDVKVRLSSIDVTGAIQTLL
ncbi:MAG TPA: hypothetical protein VMS75_06805 [Terriglobales bacterium]|nr:hypothetical protein [Terriglobales bacterium]